MTVKLTVPGIVIILNFLNGFFQQASGVFDQYPEVALAVEEKYKHAVGEMIESLSS